MISKQKQAAFIISKLEQLFPNPDIPLTHHNPFTLLIAVLLSAQTTDVAVNKVTPELFRLAPTAEEMIKLKPSQIEKIIKSIGLAPTKAKNIHALSKILIKNFNGEVPNNFSDLESLPGVGHKTASVIMAQAFNVPAFPVDTHIHRLAQRWNLSDGSSVKKTEEDLKFFFPKEKWNKLHLQMIYYGRKYCPARNHDMEVCEICRALSLK